MASSAIDKGHEVPDDVLAAIDYCYEQGWTDGLPVVPPETGRVEAMMAMEGRPPETVLAHHPATGLELTIRAAAVNAVMAGCLPEYFPVIVAAFEAMDREPFNFHASSVSTGGSGHLLIVSGPVVEEIGMNASGNLFGPGNRANATIGRAVRLALLNVFRTVPGLADRSTQGHPGKYSFCIAERADRNPWPPLCEELGYPEGVSSVTVYAGAGFMNVENHGGNTPEAILEAMADAMANYGCITAGQSVVVICPEHVEIIARGGWTKPDGEGVPLRARAAAQGGHGAYRQVRAPRIRAPGQTGLPPGPESRRHSHHRGRRRRGWPFGVHPVLEPRQGLDHAEPAHRRVHRLLMSLVESTAGDGRTRDLGGRSGDQVIA